MLTKLVPFTVRVNAAPPGAAEDGLKLVMVGAGFTTAVITFALSFAPFESVEVVVTVAVLLSAGFVAVGITTSVIVEVAPLKIVPRLHVTVIVPLQLP